MNNTKQSPTKYPKAKIYLDYHRVEIDTDFIATCFNENEEVVDQYNVKEVLGVLEEINAIE
ncbi:MAG TPA: hypothetical protein VNQ78_11770 [Paracoccus sp. (in: a-proteobacteria)]|nr:hypothetical protein [Paracoccus sp. (in: a-proteobacteria)]